MATLIASPSWASQPEACRSLAAVKAIPTYNIDGYFLTEQPTETFAKGNQTKVPLLIGGNNQEMSPWAVLAGKQPTVENLKVGAKAMFGDNVDEAFRLYGINSDKDVLEQPGINLASDSSSITPHGNGATCISSQAVNLFIAIAIAILAQPWLSRERWQLWLAA